MRKESEEHNEMEGKRKRMENEGEAGGVRKREGRARLRKSRKVKKLIGK